VLVPVSCGDCNSCVVATSDNVDAYSAEAL
jgi:hypothetical protein